MILWSVPLSPRGRGCASTGRVNLHQVAFTLLVLIGVIGNDVCQGEGFFPRFSAETLVHRNSHSTVTIGPDGNLYATTTNTGGRSKEGDGSVKEHLGQVYRYVLDPETGHVLGEQLLATMTGPVNGFAFAPTASENNLLFYVTVLDGRGHINRLKVKPAGESDPLLEDTIVVDRLGRGGNHGMNNLAFGPNGKLYANQGGRTFWGTEEENHTAAVLTIDLSHADFRNGAVAP